MKQLKIQDPKRNGYYFVIEGDDFEYVNPILKMSEIMIQSMFLFTTNMLMFAKENNKLPNIEGDFDRDAIIRKIALRKGMKIWEEELQNIRSQSLPKNIYNILTTTSKKEQIKVLKGLSLTVDELTLFIFKAWENYGFTYSMYTSQHSHKGLDERKMPRFAYKEDNNNITIIGKTPLTEGQIKHAIEYRKVTVSKFLDKGSIWHCFFLTYKSLKGTERGWVGKPHMHYISSNWGLSRNEVLSQLKSKNYKLPSSLPHIEFHTHRNPRL